MIAVGVSVANGCIYCQAHHGAALLAYWKDKLRVKQLMKGYRLTGLPEKEMAICKFPVHLTKFPAVHEAINSVTV